MSTQTTVNPFFTPPQIAGCQLWLDAADTTSLRVSGSNVTQWNDKSGTSKTVTFAGTNTYNSTTQSVNTTNSPTSYFYANVNLKKSQVPYANVFLVHTWTGSSLSGTNQALWGQDIGGGYNRFQLLQFTAIPSYAYGLSYTPSSPFVATVSALNTGNRVIYSARYAYQVTNGTAAFVNGTLSSSEVTEAFSPGETSTTNTYFGTIDTGYSGRVAFHEIIIYTSAITTAQRQQIEGYLAWKWNLQANLPANHPYKSSPIAPLLNPPTSLPVIIQNVTSTFSPIQISGCQLWLDARDSSTFTLSGSNIIQWSDKSGNANNATVQTGSTVYSNNGVVFTGAQMLQTPLSATMLNQSFFSVLSSGSNAANMFAVSIKSPSLSVGYNYIINTNQQLVTRFGGTNVMTGATPQQSSTYLYNATLTSGGSSFLYANGTQTGSNTTTPAISGTGATVGIGAYYYPTADPGPTGFFTGTINEILIFNLILTVNQRQQVEGYLAWKWGLQGSLPATHPYKLGPPYSTTITAPSRSIGIGRGWQPTQISGCQLWLDAADAATMTLSQNSVTLWRDKSGNARDATGSGTPTLLQDIQNKLPAIFFNGSSYFTGSLTNTTAIQSFFSVFRFNTGAPQYARLASFGVNGQFDYNNNAYYNLSYNTGTLAITRSPTETQVTLSPALDAFHQTSILFNGTNGLYYVDGGAYSNSAAWTANFNFNQYRLGTDQIVHVPQILIGYIAEIIVYSTAVTTSQRQQIEGYLAWKWGLVSSLPSNHPYKKWPPSP